MLDLINAHSKILSECEATFAKLNPKNPQEFVQMYIKFAPTYTVAAKIFHNLNGTQDPRMDLVLREAGIVVPSKEEILKHQQVTKIFLQRVHAFADKVDAFRKEIDKPLAPEFHKAFSAQEKKPSPPKKNDGLSFVKPGFLLPKTK